MEPVDAAISEHLIHASYDENVKRIFFRPVSEFKVAVIEKNTNRMVADLREYMLEPRVLLFFDFTDLPGLARNYRCHTTELSLISNRKGHVLSEIFE